MRRPAISEPWIDAPPCNDSGLSIQPGSRRAPLRYRTEVPLRPTTDHPEQRSWDAVLSGNGARTAIELEMRLYDAQAQTRRLHLKQRDDAPDHMLVVVAATRANRRVLDEFGELLADWPRLGTAAVLKTLRAGRHPGTGLILV